MSNYWQKLLEIIVESGEIIPSETSIINLFSSFLLLSYFLIKKMIKSVILFKVIGLVFSSKGSRIVCDVFIITPAERLNALICIRE